jgi:succinoglycan biosynthesis transport protein ExoP
MSKLTPYPGSSHPLPPTDGERLLPQEEETVNLRDYWIIIRKYRWTIATLLLPIVLITAISVWWTGPFYTATATLYIENQTANIMGDRDASALGGSNSENYFYKTQLNLLRSRSLAARVIQDLGLDHDLRFGMPTQDFLSWVQSQVRWVIGSIAGWLREMSLVKWIQGRFKAVGEEEERKEEKKIEVFELEVHPGLIDRYLAMLGTNREKETQLIEVSVRSLDPSLSKEVVNAHITTFIRMSLLTRFELTAEARQFLEEKLAELKSKLEQSDEDLNRFRKAHPIVALDKGENLIVERLTRLNGDLTNARSKRIELESIHRSIQQRDNWLISPILNNPLVQQIKDQISILEREKARSATTFKSTHPSMKALQEQIDEAKSRLDQEVRRIVRSIESDYNVAKAREAAVTQEMEEQRRAALDLREKAIEGAILERDVESNRKLYEDVLKRTKETVLTGAAPISNIRVVDRADVPLQPDAMRDKRHLLLSVLVGLLGGVGLAFLRHYLDNSLKTPEDIGRFLRLPTLGMVPDIKQLERRGYRLGNAKKTFLPQRPSKSQKGEIGGFAISLNPLSIISESYQTLCTALLFSLPDRSPRTILITSSQPQEGKTVTAIAIATILARNGASVLLIDADLRNGHCHRLLGLQNGSGLTNVLTGQVSATECIQRTAIDHLSLLSRGEFSPNPAALLGSETIRQMLESLEADFPFIIIDSAPLLPITDTVLLSTKVDGVLLVAKAQEVSRYAAHKACERLAYVKARILGVVLNNIDIRSPEYEEYRRLYEGYYAAYATKGSSASVPSPDSRTR